MVSDDTIRATIVEKMHNAGYYERRSVSVDVAAKLGIASHNRGRAKKIVRELANGPAPVHWHAPQESVYLEADHQRVARWIETHGGPEAVPWDLQSELEQDVDRF